MRLSDNRIPFAFAAITLLVHLLTNTRYGFHRDELLYLALGRHLDWGFWSNPPFIGFLSYLSQNILGDSLFATRLAPAIFAAGLIFLTCLICREMGGQRFSQWLTGLVCLTSLAFLRSGHLFMPVIIDIFFWTLCSWLVVKYLKTKNEDLLLWLGAATGLGLLNKYSVLFLIAALAIAFLLTPERRIFLRKKTWISAGIALLILLPNLIWQWAYNFPVVYHMTHLADSHLDNVHPLIFLLDQLLLHFWGFLVWIPGLIFLLKNDKMKPYRVVGWTFLLTILLFLVFSGKNYYTLGAYPVVIAAGSVFWEQKLIKTSRRIILALLIFLLNLPLLPTGIPILSIPGSVAYFEAMVNELGITSATRWEQGNVESLPQDYADMLGWQELASIVDQAADSVENTANLFLYCENYGQAGAVGLFSTNPLLPQVVSFSDTYRIWAPDTLDPAVNTMIYVNDELGEDVEAVFQRIEIIGEVQEPLARERGTKVYLCREPRTDFGEFWKKRVAMVKSYFRE